MNDPIQAMSESERIYQCEEILGDCLTPMHLTGLIIIKLQEWECDISWIPCNGVWIIDNSLREGEKKIDANLQIAFLRTAQALGKWEPAKKEEEVSFYYWRNKISGSIVEMRPEFIASMATHPEEWQRVNVTTYNPNIK